MSVRPVVRAALLVVLAGCAPPVLSAAPPAWVNDTSSFGPAPAPTLADRYAAPAAKILEAARADRSSYAQLAELTDEIGPRPAGSAALDHAIAWATKQLQDAGLSNVHTEPVQVPHWVRGAEAAAIVRPAARPLSVIGLGGSVSTPPGGLTAPLVVVHDWDELAARAADVKGAIVLYDVAMPPYTREGGSHYGDVSLYRWRGARKAAPLGAVAVLVRSATARSLGAPHTGGLNYADVTPQIPAGAITLEDAALLARLAARGPVSVHLQLESKRLPDAPSANVVGELRGRERPDEVVLLGAHLDSWDVGQGAHDDGAGVATMLGAVRLLHQLGLTPRRTIRVVLFTAEEMQVVGAQAYAKAHQAELGNVVATLESDIGGFAPRGFTATHADAAKADRVVSALRAIVPLLRPLRATEVVSGTGGTDDVEMLEAGRMPTLGLLVDYSTYFDYHHSVADTLDKVDPAALAADVAAVAVMAYVVAELPGRLDE